MPEIVTPPADPVTPPAAVPPVPPAPVDPATPPAPPAAPAPVPVVVEPTREELAAQLAEVKSQLAAADPILQEHSAAQEAAKSENQKVLDRAEASEKRAAEMTIKYVAAQHGIAPENIDLLGTGTLEELEARAVRLAALSPTPVDPAAPVTPAAPPSQRPVEALKPGASPAPPVAPDRSYPASWLPSRRAN